MSTAGYPMHSEEARRAWELYEPLRRQLEVPDNIGKMVIFDLESGDFEVDQLGIESSHRLEARHPGGKRYGLRIGYRTADSFAGVLERTSPQ